MTLAFLGWWTLVLALLAAGCSPARHQTDPGEWVPADLEPFAVQMHLHGHSHHNGDPRPGSMQWHSHFADASGLDVLWWSDHSEMFDLSSPLELDFERPGARIRPTRSALRQAGHLGFEDFGLDVVKAPAGDAEWVRSQVRSVAGRRRLVARSAVNSPAFAQSLYEVRQKGAVPKGFLLPRPVSSGAVLSVDLDAGVIGPDQRFEVDVGLSWHHRGAPRRQAIRYRLVAASSPAQRTVVKESTAVISVPVAAGRTTVSFDLDGDARLLQDGGDNTITSVRFRVASRRGAQAALDVYGVRLASRAPEPEHQLAALNRFADAYADEYGHRQNVGVEFLHEDDDYTHINAFLPDGALTGALASGDPETWDDPAEFVRRVKAAGGVTSFNHLFGTSTARGRNSKQEERRSRARALDLLDTGAYGTDILEVGYLGRGGVGLEYHLRTWDLLTARGLFLYGNGVSDAHGSQWGPEMKPNPFVTWVWSASGEADRLIEAMRAGRLVFGDPFQSLKRLYFSIGTAEMGDRVAVSEKEQTLRVVLDQSFDSLRHRLYLVHGLIRPEESEVAYLTETQDGLYRREIDSAALPVLDVSRPCFVRLEVFDVEGRPLLFSNPIVFE